MVYKITFFNPYIMLIMLVLTYTPISFLLIKIQSSFVHEFYSHRLQKQNKKSVLPNQPTIKWILKQCLIYYLLFKLTIKYKCPYVCNL